MFNRNEYMRRRRLRLKAEGLCVKCALPTVPNKTLCEKHAGEYSRAAKQVRTKKIAAAACSTCGGPKGQDGKTCDSCREKNKVISSKAAIEGRCSRCRRLHTSSKSLCDTCRPWTRQRSRERKEQRRSQGVCVTCGIAAALPTGHRCRECYLCLTADNVFGSVVAVSALLRIAERQNHKCPFTGNAIRLGENCELDHALPAGRGGETSETNLRWVATEVNRGKGNRTDDEYLSLIAEIQAHLLGGSRRGS